jgi:hypothetical protein
MNNQIVYPLVEYAQKIQKNTAELTTADMVAFMKWYMMQPQRKDLLMAKSYATKKFQDAHTGRLAEQGIESPINDGEEEIVIHKDNEIVCDMGLTKMDVTALKWALERIFADYELTNDTNDDGGYGMSLQSLKEALEGV